MLSDIYNEKITILTRWRRSDSKKELDTWYKYTINDCAWYTDSARSAGGNAVYIGTYITALIPFHDDFVPYIDWKKLSDEDKQNLFTISNGDYLILGGVSEDINASNVVATVEQYQPNVCLVRHVQQVHDRFGATVQLKVQGV